MGKLKTERSSHLSSPFQEHPKICVPADKIFLKMFEKNIEALHGYLTSVFFLCTHGCFSAQGIEILLRCFSSVLKPGPDHQLAGPVELSIYTSYGLA